MSDNITAEPTAGKTTTKPILGEESEPMAVANVEQELGRRLQNLQSQTGEMVIRAQMSTLVIYCDKPALAAQTQKLIPEILALHPARIILLVGSADAPTEDLKATVRICAHPRSTGATICSEEITLYAAGAAVQKMPSAVRSLVLGDMPMNLWWAPPQAPPMGDVLFHELSDDIEEVIYDSMGWPDPTRGMLAVTAWVARLEETARGMRWRLAADLNWRRLKYWRRILTQALDPATAPGRLNSIQEVVLEHGPHAVIQGWLIYSWLASRLGWRVQSGHVQPGVEMNWQCDAPHGKIRLKILRAAEGPSAIHRLRIVSNRSALDFVMEDERRLAVIPEGDDAVRRTVTVPAQPLSELVGRELSDRERDPVFRDSLQVARVFAQSVQG